MALGASLQVHGTITVRQISSGLWSAADHRLLMHAIRDGHADATAAVALVHAAKTCIDLTAKMRTSTPDSIVDKSNCEETT